MASICREAEADINYSELYPTLRRQVQLPIGITEAIAASAGKLYSFECFCCLISFTAFDIVLMMIEQGAAVPVEV